MSGPSPVVGRELQVFEDISDVALNDVDPID